MLPYLLLCFVCQQLVLSLPCSSSGWDMIKTLDEVDGLGFRQIAWPLVQITANAYRYPQAVAVEGWTVASRIQPLAPLHGGAHAVVYEETSSSSSSPPAASGYGKRLVVAFRGTDLSGDEGSRADLCADWILFSDDDRVLPKPKSCAKFSNATLDYFTQALNFTTEVMQAYPNAPLLLTGHSLGATLALLVSAALSEHCILPVVAFSAGGAKQILEKKQISLEADKKHKVFVISDEWDEVMRTSWKKQMKPGEVDDSAEVVEDNVASDALKSLWMPRVFHSGSCFRFEITITQTKPPGFLEGMEPVSRDLMSTLENLACLDCFFRTHYLKHVMSLVDAGTQPVCVPF